MESRREKTNISDINLEILSVSYYMDAVVCANGCDYGYAASAVCRLSRKGTIDGSNSNNSSSDSHKKKTAHNFLLRYEQRDVDESFFP